jgi:hypothetical protein
LISAGTVVVTLGLTLSLLRTRSATEMHIEPAEGEAVA